MGGSIGAAGGTPSTDYRAAGATSFGTTSNATATGGTSSLANTTAAGTAITGGANSNGGNQASGCSGSFETLQSAGSGICVAAMASIPRPTSGVYYIDATEVTIGQYNDWLVTNPPLPASSDDACGWDMSYAPDALCLRTGSCREAECDHHPQVCIDWCDASAYCKAVGKRLCGAINGGSIPIGDGADTDVSQWYRACTSAGKLEFPYGNNYQPGYCNDSSHNLLLTDVVG